MFDKLVNNFIYYNHEKEIIRFMIHSLAGGSLREKRVEDFALVEIIDGIMKGGKFWYIVKDKTITAGDNVVVPLGRTNAEQQAKVLRIDKNVVEGQTPVPLRSAKTILRKL